MEDRMIIYALAMECPLDYKCIDCSLRELRKIQDFEKIVDIIDNMTIDEINKIYEYHKTQRWEREKHL